MTNNNYQVPLSETVENFIHWHSTFAPADQNIDSVRAAYNAFWGNYIRPRDQSFHVVDYQTDATQSAEAIPFRIYTPNAPIPESGWPWVLFLHGGDWIAGSSNTHEGVTSQLAKSLQAAIITVDYRLAPESTYPAAHDDVITLFEDLMTRFSSLNLNSSLGIIAGDGVGGNLALHIAQKYWNQIRGLALIYPNLNGVVSQLINQSSTNEAQKLQRETPLLRYNDLISTFKQYAPDMDNQYPSDLFPLVEKTSFSLPQTYVAVAELDPLYPDGIEFIHQLNKEEIPTALYIAEGLPHGALRVIHDCTEAYKLYDSMIKAMGKMLE